MPHHIFLSYSRRDAEIMGRVRDLLREGGLGVWTDENLEPGTSSWKDAIQEALDTAQAIVVILSPDAKQSAWVKRELDYASTLNLRIFPVLARGTDRDAIPFLLAGAQYADVTRDFDKGIQPFRKALHNFLKVPLPQPPPQPASSHAPPPQEAVAAPAFVAQQLTLVPAPAFYIRLRQIAPLLLLVVTVVVFGLVNNLFLDSRSVVNVMRNAVPVGLMAVGMTVVILAGGIDLSVGKVFALCACPLLLFVNRGATISPLITLLVMVGVGLVIGLIIGYFVMRLRKSAVLQLDAQQSTSGLIPALLITLFALYLLNPVVFILTEGQVYSRLQDYLYDLYSIEPGGVPLPFIIFIIVALVTHFVMQRLWLYQKFALARTDRQQARQQGIHVDRLTIGSYAFLGLLAGLAAFFWVARVQIIDPNIGQGMELTVIASVIVGGTSLFRAEGNVLRTIIGVICVSVLPAGFAFLRLPSYWQTIPTLVVVLVFVALDFLAMPRPKLVMVES